MTSKYELMLMQINAIKLQLLVLEQELVKELENEIAEKVAEQIKRSELERNYESAYAELIMRFEQEDESHQNICPDCGQTLDFCVCNVCINCGELIDQCDCYNDDDIDEGWNTDDVWRT